MLRRAQFALALVLLLVLAPLARATCGIRCLTATPHHAIAATASQQHDCVLASACCHSTGPAICSATQAPEAVAALLSTDASTADAPALGVIAAESLPQNSRTVIGHGIDSSPPGQFLASSPIPLRI